MHGAGAEAAVEVGGIDDMHGHTGGGGFGGDAFGRLRRGEQVEQLALAGDERLAHGMRAVEAARTRSRSGLRNA